MVGAPSSEAPTIDGNTQLYIIAKASEACRQGDDAAMLHFLAQMNEVLDKRSHTLSRANLSTLFHRCARVANATHQASLLQFYQWVWKERGPRDMHCVSM